MSLWTCYSAEKRAIDCIQPGPVGWLRINEGRVAGYVATEDLDSGGRVSPAALWGQGCGQAASKQGAGRQAVSNQRPAHRHGRRGGRSRSAVRDARGQVPVDRHGLASRYGRTSPHARRAACAAHALQRGTDCSRGGISGRDEDRLPAHDPLPRGPSWRSPGAAGEAAGRDIYRSRPQSRRPCRQCQPAAGDDGPGDALSRLGGGLCGPWPHYGRGGKKARHRLDAPGVCHQRRARSRRALARRRAAEPAVQRCASQREGRRPGECSFGRDAHHLRQDPDSRSGRPHLEQGDRVALPGEQGREGRPVLCDRAWIFPAARRPPRWRRWWP